MAGRTVFLGEAPGYLVRNVFGWVFALVPVAGIIFDLVFRGPLAVSGWNEALVVILVNSVLCMCDERLLRQAGYKAMFTGLASVLFLVPFYLWRRSSILKQDKKLFIVWTVGFAVWVLIGLLGVPLDLAQLSRLVEIDARLRMAPKEGRIGLVQTTRIDLERMGHRGVRPAVREAYDVLFDCLLNLERLETEYEAVTRKDRIHYTFNWGRDGVCHSFVTSEVKIESLKQSDWRFGAVANKTARSLGGSAPYEPISKYVITIRLLVVSAEAAAWGKSALEGTVDPQVVICTGSKENGFFAEAETTCRRGSRSVDFGDWKTEIYYLASSESFIAVVDVDEESEELLDMVSVPKRNFHDRLAMKNGSEVQLDIQYEEY